MRFFYFVLVLSVLFVVWTINEFTPIDTRPLPDNVTYTEHILPLFKIKCSGCHNSNWPRANWMDYALAYNNRNEIVFRVNTLSMPIGLTTTVYERRLISEWVKQGAKK